MAQRLVKRGSILLIHYPFTNLSAVKVRPAVVLTPDSLLAKLNNVLCLFISSSIPAELFPTDFILETTHPSFHATGLKYRLGVRTHKIALLHKSLVTRVLGEVDMKNRYTPKTLFHLREL